MAVPNGNAIHAPAITTRPLILTLGKIRVRTIVHDVFDNYI